MRSAGASKGFRKRYPSNPQANKKASVLRKHMIAVRSMLDVHDDHGVVKDVRYVRL